MKQHVHFALAVLFLVFDISVACITGHVRLANQILEICNNSVWKTICSENWGNLDAAVACKQLEFAGGYTVNTVSFNRSLLNPIAYHCNGTESSLQNCDHESNDECNRGVNITCVHRNTSDSCRRGDVRLRGGRNQYEGNIELCTDQGIWSTISDFLWGSADAVVACRQLGYYNTNFIAVPFSRSKFGEQLQAMEYGGIQCRGNETSLLHCSIYSRFVKVQSKLTISNHRDYAGVKCILRSARPLCNNGAVRLIHGYSNNNGVAEVCIEGEWIGICKSGCNFDTSDPVALRICNQLGYQRFTSIHEGFFTSNRSEPLAYVYPNGYYCYSRSQTQVLDCFFRSAYYGFEYMDRCIGASQGVLCCPNDTAQCSFSGPQNLPMSPGNPRLQPSRPSTACEMATVTSSFITAGIGTTTFSLNPTFLPELRNQGSPSSINSGSLIGGIIGGVIIIMMITILSIIIILVLLSCRKGTSNTTEVVYEEPDLNLYREKKLKKIKDCPAHSKNINHDVEMKECPAYGHL